MNQYLNFSLEGKVALVTGASYGIGFAIASAFAEQGATICFNDINQELVDKGLASYAEKGIKAHGYVCDVTDEPAVQAMVATIAKEVGTIDILVNNAGIIRRVPMHEMEAADFRRVIDIDLNAPFIVSKAVLPAMMEKGHGKIINICSMMSELGRETVSAYAAAKGGLKMLTRNICSEYGEYNIQCNGIGPGYIATPQTAPLREIQPDGSRHPFDTFICAKTPAGRWLDPQEYEPAVQAMVATIAKEVGTIDILVNNAGIIRRVPMHEMEAADFRRVIDIDLNAPFIVSKAVLPAMMEKGHGKIINICSMMSELGRETVSAYAAAKGGLKMLTRNICSEYGEYNIQCNGIGPGYIATPQTAPLREIQPDGSRHPFDTFICAKTPAGRWLDPQELTGPAVFLASEASNAVNGHILYVDGGILAYIGKQPK